MFWLTAIQIVAASLVSLYAQNQAARANQPAEYRHTLKNTYCSWKPVSVYSLQHDLPCEWRSEFHAI